MKSLSPKQVASAIGVSESSLKRWCDKGIIQSSKTVGGHRRISPNSVIRYLKDAKRPLISPAILGLSEQGLPRESSLEQIVERFADGLVKGDEAHCRRIAVDLFMADYPISKIGDLVIKPAFERIGCNWQNGSVEIFQERRACQVASKIIGDMSQFLALPQEGPVAIGGTIEHDNYALPCKLVESVLRQHGWRAQSLGTNIPFTSLAAAVADQKPKLFWLSVSYIREDVGSFVRGCNMLFDHISGSIPFVVGGNALVSHVRQQIRYTAFCENLQQLEAFAQTVYSPGNNSY